MRTSTFLVALLLLLPAPDGSRAEGARPWVSVSAGINSYAMDDVNDGIASLNALIAPATLDEIGTDFGFGAALGVDLARISASLGYERLPARTSVSGAYGDWDYDLAADAFLARVAYRVPVAHDIDVGLGVGAGVAIASGEFGAANQIHPNAIAEKTAGSSTQAVILGPRPEISGNGLCLEGFVQGEARVGRRFAILPALGYRRAKIEGTQRGSEGEADGTFDFSGLSARVALKVAFD
jgi:hypothetical protein